MEKRPTHGNKSELEIPAERLIDDIWELRPDSQRQDRSAERYSFAARPKEQRIEEIVDSSVAPWKHRLYIEVPNALSRRVPNTWRAD
jgi:hypothetical protein